MAKLRYAAGAVAALCALLPILYFALAFSAFDAGFFEKEYGKNGTYKAVRMEKDELMKVTRQMIEYLRLKEDNLNISVNVDGQERLFFSDREIYHMGDVRLLFEYGWNITIAAGTVSLVLLVFLAISGRGFLTIISRCFFWIFSGFSAVSAIVLGLIAFNFERAFILFHKLFFSNDLWLLDPNVDLLINIVPLQFFLDISVRIALTFYGVIAVIGLIAFALVRYSRRKGV